MKKLNKNQLKRIIKEEKYKLMRENLTSSYGNTPVVSFNPDKYPDAGYLDILESILYIMEELSDGLVRLMNPIEYEDMLETMEEMAGDGDEDIMYYLPKLSATKQGQYVRIALR